MIERETHIEDEKKMYFDMLFKLNRSLTGEGVRESMRILKEITPFNTYEVPSGTKVFDWEVPKEWNAREAFIKTVEGQTIIDFKRNNLHLVGYSIPFKGVLSREELDKHLYSTPQKPDAIPYRTSYYEPSWGFCLSENERKNLKEDYYAVKVDTELKDGSMTMGEAVIEGTSGKEFIISTYSCHPSMANDNLSGMLGWAYLLKELRKAPTKHTYRFIIGPETIGALTYLAKHDVSKVKGALVLTHLAGWGDYSFKKTFEGNSEIDKAIESTFREFGIPHTITPFNVKGSDERQFSSPGFRIPTGLITKPALYDDPNYHTSRDDSFSSNILEGSLLLYKKVIDKLEHNETYERTNPYGEPKLSGRNLYPKIGGPTRPDIRRIDYPRTIKVEQNSILMGDPTDALLWVLFYSDGKHSLLDISEKTNFPLEQLHEASQLLIKEGLIK